MTARRRMREVKENGQSTPRRAILESSERSLAFAFNPSESYLIGQAVKLNQQAEANIEKEQQRKAAEERQVAREERLAGCTYSSVGHFCP